MKITVVLFLILFLFFSCASSNKPFYETRDYSFLNDPITVSTTLKMAQAAYIRGCYIEGRKMQAKDVTYDYCAQESKKYLDEEVIIFLKQDGKKKKESK